MPTLPSTSLVLAIAFVFTVGQAPAQTFAPPSPASDNPTREVSWTAGEVTRTLFTKKSRDLWQYVRGGVAFTLKMKALDSGHSYQITRGKGYGGTVTFGAGFTDLPVSGVAAYTWSFTAHSPSRRYEQGQPLAVVVVTDQTTRQSQVITFEIEGTPTPTGDDFQRTNNIPNAMVQLDLCPDTRAPMRIVSSATGRVRTWPFVRHRELVSFEVQNVNTLRHKVTITGELRDLVPAVGRNVIAELIGNGSKARTGGPGAAAAPPTDEERIAAVRAIIEKLKRVKEYSANLDALRKRLATLDCATPEQVGAGNELVGLDYGPELLVGSEALRQKIAADKALADEEIKAIAVANQGTLQADLSAAYNAITDAELRGLVAQVNELKTVVVGTARSMPKLIYGKNADAVRFTVTRATIGATGAEQSETYDLPIVGGLKFDLSAGFFFTQLVDNVYAFRSPTPDELKKSNVRDAPDPPKETDKAPTLQDIGKLTVGIGTLLHVYTRPNIFHGFLNPGLCLGASLHSTGGTAKTRYHFGVSLLLGRGQRAVLSAGMAAGGVARLSAVYEVGRFENFGNVTAVPTENRTEVRWFKALGFFSLTYNLNLNSNAVVN